MRFLSGQKWRWQTGSSSSTSRMWIFLNLLLCPATSAAEKTAADYYIRSLPGQPDGPLLNMHAGHIEITPEHHGNLFFWHFENRHIANRKRTVIWLNGGPGCSSMDGALMEIGPYRLKDDAHLVYNEGSWDEFANLLFIDNPVGTGFSYVDTDSFVHELKPMADQLIIFLEKFFALFPEHEDNDIYISGESYAGQHIPYLAQAILERNASPGRRKRWNLQGLLIGNGWIAPVEQYNAYLDYAYKANLIRRDSDEGRTLETIRSDCIRSIGAPGGEHVTVAECEKLLTEILRLSKKDGRCFNMYDVRLFDDYPSCGMAWPPDLDDVTPYLRRKDVVEALHINKAKQTGWTECGGAVGSHFDALTSQPTIHMLPDILKEVPVVLFSGDQDLICNHLGTEEFIHNLEWNGGTGFELSPGTWAPRRDWTFEGEPAGFYQEARNLTYILYYNSSHMVPFDYPRRTRDMLDRFIGVDIASIGGAPTDSRIDGEKGLETSVGGHPNSTLAEQAEQDRLEDAKWAAYYHSGEVALIVVSILASVWGWYVWRQRGRRAGYQGLLAGSTGNFFGELANNDGSNLARHKFHRGRDVEAADFDESELDQLHVVEPREDGVRSHDDDEEEGRDRLSPGEGSSSEGREGGYDSVPKGHGRGEEKSRGRRLR